MSNILFMTVGAAGMAPAIIGDEAPKRSIWGQVDHCSAFEFDHAGKRYRVHSVGTPSHGGFKLPRALNALVPETWRRAGGWYEEDCDWCIPVCVFAGLGVAVGDRSHVAAWDTLRNWHPACWEHLRPDMPKLTGAESYIRGEEEFEAATVNHLVVISAMGDWCDALKASGAAGWVACYATMGGKREGRKARYFVVPEVEYDQRGKYGFVVDETRHPEIACEFDPFNAAHVLMPTIGGQAVPRDWATSFLKPPAAPLGWESVEGGARLAD
jgi:hypothetical protein